MPPKSLRISSAWGRICSRLLHDLTSKYRNSQASTVFSSISANRWPETAAVIIFWRNFLTYTVAGAGRKRGLFRQEPGRVEHLRVRPVNRVSIDDVGDDEELGVGWNYLSTLNKSEVSLFFGLFSSKLSTPYKILFWSVNIFIWKLIVEN